ncbi:hypothetical protein [Methylomonas fluvii]|nr:hypothetical protein [Methylomonas fluvii]
MLGVGNAGYLRINSSSGEAIFALPLDRVQVAMTV